MIYSNTTSDHPTHFVRAVELIEKARSDFNVPSENWPSPTQYRFGTPNDYYYAELWGDGMDWQISYWVIEQISYESPHIFPLIIFNNHSNREKFNEYDFKMFIKGMLHFRRDSKVLKLNDLGIYTDMSWPFLNLKQDCFKHGSMKYFEFSHASQVEVCFWANTEFIPEQYIRYKLECDNVGIGGTLDESNRNYWNSPQRLD